MTNFFSSNDSVESIKKQYKKLVFQYHPDLGGDEEMMKQLNQEYFDLLKSVDNTFSTGQDGKEYKYSFNEEREQEITDFLDKFYKLNLSEDVQADLIGIYVWISGNTKPVKDKLKGIGCWWHSVRECWYFKPTGVKSRRSNGSLEELADKYGVTNVSFARKKA